MRREEQFINCVRYSDVARAISRDFSRIFCVNTDTNVFVEFIPHEQDEKLDICTSGENFHDIVQSFEESVYPPDLDTFHTAVTKQNILNVLSVDDSFILNYRTMMNDRPTYVKLKATRLQKDDPSHILIALSNTDAHMQRLAIYERAMNNRLTFAAVSEALAADYDCIFYVDTQTNEFIEYSSSETYKSLDFLDFSPAGNDFFEMCKNDFIRVVYHEDRDIFLRAFDKKNFLEALESEHLPLLSFRVNLKDSPVHVLVKITKMNHLDDHHVVLGLSNIEANLPRIQQYEQMREIANRDSLTGVKSKHAFSVDEERINREISQGEAAPFAVVVCDVNGLKHINDTQGHPAGDDYLRKSCRMICNVFSHSPVYRIGGDEFAAILLGRDYQSRGELIQELHNLSTAHIGTEEAIVSCGLAEYNPGRDHCLRDIFERADTIMYKEKMLLKSLGAATREDGAFQEDVNIPVINMRKHILIADDQEINRKILGELLEDDYDILKASDGVETMEMLRLHKDEIALVLLDLYMPRMDGQEVLKQMQTDEELMAIPVIMLTVDPDAELDSLKLGAMDFISKPYPDINIVKARIAKCIELSENRDLIRHTERDKLTGLLHFDYFMRYVMRFDQQYKGASMDAFVCDIQHFHYVNEQYGRQFGDLVLRDIGINIRKLARKTGGIGCRQNADTFLLYFPHQDDYEQLIAKFCTDLFVDEATADKVKLRFGVFANANQESNIEKRFSRAKAAADSVSDCPERICGFYHP